MVKFKSDEIGPWSEIKLEIIEKYAAAYTKILSRSQLKFEYIDGFCGAGEHISKKTKQSIEGSPVRALNVEPPFNHYHFIDLDGQKTAHLQETTKGLSNGSSASAISAERTTCHSSSSSGVDVTKSKQAERFRAVCGMSFLRKSKSASKEIPSTIHFLGYNAAVLPPARSK